MAGLHLTPDNSIPLIDAPSGWEKFGRGLDIDSVSGRIARVTSDDFNITGDQSWCMVWEQTSHGTATANTGGFTYTAAASTGATSGLAVSITDNTANDSLLRVRIQTTSGSEEWVSTGTVVIGMNVAYGWIDSTTGAVVAYLNGVLEINSTLAGTRVSNPGDDFIIGSNRGDGANAQKGSIYEIRIWDKLVPQSVLDQIVSQDGYSTNLGDELAVYRFNDEKDGRLNRNLSNWWEDSSNNNNYLELGANWLAGAAQPFTSSIAKFGEGWERPYLNSGTDRLLYKDAEDFNIIGDLSITLVFKADAEFNIVNNPSNIIYCTNGTSNLTAGCWGLEYFRPATGQSYLRYRQQDAGGTTLLGGPGVSEILANGDMHTVTLRRYGNQIDLSLDGSVVDSTTFTAPVTSQVNPRLAIFSRANGSNNNGFQGGIAECRIWDKDIPQSILHELVSSSGISTALGDELAYYKFQEEDGSFNHLAQKNWWQDSSDNSYYLEQGSASTSDHPAISGAEKWVSGREFNVVNQGLSIFDDSSLSITGDLCIAIVIEIDSLPGVGQNGHIVRQGASGGNLSQGDRSYAFGMLEATAANNWQFRQNGTTPNNFNTGTSATTGLNRITIRRDNTAKTLVIKVNGTEILNTTYTGSVTNSDFEEFAIMATSGNLQGVMYHLSIFDSLIPQQDLDDIVDNAIGDDSPIGEELTCFRFRNVE